MYECVSLCESLCVCLLWPHTNVAPHKGVEITAAQFFSTLPSQGHVCSLEKRVEDYRWRTTTSIKLKYFLVRNIIISAFYCRSNYTYECHILYIVLNACHRVLWLPFALLFPAPFCLCHCVAVRLDCYGLLWRLCCGRNANCWHIIMSLARAQYKDNRIQVGLQ